MNKHVLALLLSCSVFAIKAQGPTTITMTSYTPSIVYDRVTNPSGAIAVGVSSTATSTFATSFGHNAKATGSNATALGSFLTASGSQAVALGTGTSHIAAGLSSISIGNNVKTDAAATNSLVLGKSLTNAIPNSLMIGISPSTSTLPTLFVGPAPSSTVAGNVGIGTSTPVASLHVNGNAIIESLKNTSASNNNAVYVDANGQLMRGCAMGNMNGDFWTDGGNIFTGVGASFGTNSNTWLSFMTNGKSRMLLDENGKLQIGFFNSAGSPVGELLKVYAPGGECSTGIYATGNTNAKLYMANSYGSVSLLQGEQGVGHLMWDVKNMLSFHESNLLIGAPVNASDVGEVNTNLTISAKRHSGYADPFKIVNPEALNIHTNKTLFEVSRLGKTTIALASASENNAIDVIDRSSGSDNLVFRVKRDGRVFAHAVKVTMSAFPDYVFGENYKLLPLNEVEAYIAENDHLPNVPSAAEVEKDGGDLGELLKKNFEKTEELYLYVIEMNKKIEALQKENEELKKSINQH